MKKILFVIGSLQAGGAERVATNLCSYWAEHADLDVTLVTSCVADSDFYKLSDKVKRLSIDFSFNNSSILSVVKEQFSRFFKIHSVLKQQAPDIIVLSTTEISIRFLFNLIFSRKKIIVCEHNNYYALSSTFKRLCRTVLYKKASHVFVLTERDRVIYLEKKIVADNKIVVMPNPLGIECESPNIDKQENLLLAVGRLCEQKSFDRLIEAMSDINPNFILKILGDWPDKHALQKKIDDLSLGSRVELVGKVKDISKYYQSATLLLMTSKFEGLPMVINEANNFGVPVISFDCPTGPAEMIENNLNGLLVKNGDISGFSDTVNNLTSKPEALASMRNVSIKMSKEYSISVITSKWLKFFDIEKS